MARRLTHNGSDFIAWLAGTVEVNGDDIDRVILTRGQSMSPVLFHQGIESTIVDKLLDTCTLLDHVKSIALDRNVAVWHLCPFDK